MDLENWYGPEALAHNNMPVLIYAPPGAMKTSFARTLRDYTAGRKPQDLSADPFGVCVVPIRLGTAHRPRSSPIPRGKGTGKC